MHIKTKKHKIVWIGPLSLEPLSNYLNLKISDKYHPTPWIKSLLEAINKRKDIELHYITTSTQVLKEYRFIAGNINYYYLPAGLPLFKKGFPYWFNPELYFNYRFVRKNIKKIIQHLQPDLVHSHGTENDHSIAILDIKFPKILMIQGFINDLVKFKSNRYYKKKLLLENQILSKIDHFIIRTDHMKDSISRYNKKAKFWWCYYPINKAAFELKKKEIVKDSDIIFNARIVKDKGIEDLIEALNILINIRKRNITLKICGFGDAAYISILKERIAQYGLLEHVRFIGFIETHEEALIEVKKAKVNALPSYYDNAPLTVLESMAMGVPVIAYNIPGLRNLIEDFGFPVEKGNYKMLADTIEKVLFEDVNLENKIIGASEYAEKNFDSDLIVENLINIYKDILN